MSRTVINIALLAFFLEWYVTGIIKWQLLCHPLNKIAQIITWLVSERTKTNAKLGYGLTFVLFLSAISLALGQYLHTLFSFSTLGWLAEIVIVSVLIAHKSLFQHIFEVLNRLYSTDLELCRYKLRSLVSKDVSHFDEHMICNTILLSLIENFGNAMLLPLFYYVLAGLPGLLLFKSIDLASIYAWKF
ncbi:MAG: cobalamin biosynthesis protein [Candidatus Hodgkinia cicadicola]